MSIMAVKHILITPPRLAVTAILSGSPLQFIKYFKGMIKCRGAYHGSDVLPVFMFMHDQANARSPKAQCHYPPIHALNPKGRGQKFVLAPLWGTYE